MVIRLTPTFTGNLFRFSYLSKTPFFFPCDTDGWTGMVQEECGIGFGRGKRVAFGWLKCVSTPAWPVKWTNTTYFAPVPGSLWGCRFDQQDAILLALCAAWFNLGDEGVERSGFLFSYLQNYMESYLLGRIDCDEKSWAGNLSLVRIWFVVNFVKLWNVRLFNKYSQIYFGRGYLLLNINLLLSKKLPI